MWLHSELEAALRRAGGEELLDDARTEARWYADLYHPLNPDLGAVSCIGEEAGVIAGSEAAAAVVDPEREPMERLHAWLEVLSRRLELADEDAAESG